jgi:hypothetical protein
MLSFYCQIHSKIFSVLQHSVSVPVANRELTIRYKNITAYDTGLILFGTSTFQNVFKNMAEKVTNLAKWWVFRCGFMNFQVYVHAVICILTEKDT